MIKILSEFLADYLLEVKVLKIDQHMSAVLCSFQVPILALKNDRFMISIAVFFSICTGIKGFLFKYLRQ